MRKKLQACANLTLSPLFLLSLATGNFESWSSFTTNWIFGSSGKLEVSPCAGRTGQSIGYGYGASNKNQRFAVTMDVDTRSSSSFVQFDLGVTCGYIYDTEFVELQYSVDHGKTFKILYSGCYPTIKTSGCTTSTYRTQSRFYSGEFSRMIRVTLAIPAVAR